MRMEPMLESYNDNCAIQRTSQTVGNPLLVRMASRFAERRGKTAPRLIRIAEYGCSGGRNSVEPMQQMIAALAAGSPGRQFECILEDLPSNPWHQVMVESARLIASFGEQVRVLCAGTSFYQPVCADDSVDLAYSYVSAHFLDATPPLPGHVLMHEARPDERRPWEVQAARDGERFLVLRARELKPGGSVMVSTMSRDGDGYSWQELSHLVWDSIRRTTRPGGLSPREAEALCIPACLRSEAEIMAPFASGSELAALFEVDALHFARTEIPGERSRPDDAIAPLLRRRVESVWGGVFVNQLEQFGRGRDAAHAVMTEVWDHFETAMSQHAARGWLDMRSFFLQLTRK
jgi:hypothetical protein